MPRRTELELLQDQLKGLASWQQSRQSQTAEQATASASASREARLDLRRRMEARRLEQSALIARAEHQMQDSRRRLTTTRAVLAHRNAWVRSGIQVCLAELGIEVLAELENGAEALGVTVLEQPDLLLAEELLPSLSGIELTKEAARFAPRTFIGVQVSSPASIERLMAAGARATFSRRATPAEMVKELLRVSGR